MDESQTMIKRRIKDFFLGLVMATSVAIMVIVLMSLSWSLLSRGFPALNWDFFTQLPAPPQSGERTGIANGIIGSLLILMGAFVAAAPLGLGLGVFLSEYDDRRLARWILPMVEAAAAFPSILVGLVFYSWFVKPMGGFSALAGSAALAFMMVPLIAKGCFTVFQEFPGTLREAGLALGASRWRVITRVLLPESLGGIATVLLLGLARVAGETAPLLFTSFGNPFWNFDPTQPTAAMPLQIYNYALSPYAEWHTLAWSGALVLIVFVFFINIMVRFLGRRSV